jgi:hypothetical protein
VLKLPTISFLLICVITFGCNSQNVTPNRYKNINTVGLEQYKKNIDEIADSIRSRIKSKEDPYYESEYDSLTEIIIDTILFSPANDKLAFFVITKNSNDKLLEKGNKNEFHYNAHCFIGHLNKDGLIEDMSWIRGHSLFNFRNIKNISKRIREVFFNEMTERTNLNGGSTYKYNFDYVRFWNGPIWNVYYK